MANEKYVIGVDGGTESLRAGVFDLQGEGPGLHSPVCTAVCNTSTEVWLYPFMSQLKSRNVVNGVRPFASVTRPQLCKD